MKKLIKRITARLFSIRLVDRMLLLFFVILMGYTTVHLFVHVSGETHTIDIVVRTSASAIFGYIISSQFTKSSSQAETRFPSSSLQKTSTHQDIQNQIGFQPDSPSASVKSDSSFLPKSPMILSFNENRLQIILVSLIGIASFFLLWIARFCSDNTPEVVAILSQLRDFASGCIGFLISCGKSNT